MENWQQIGFCCTSERHLDIQDNFSFADVPESKIKEMVAAVIADGCDAVAVVCTNLRAAPLVADLEAQFGVPVYDSVAVTLWATLKAAGVSPKRVHGWGSLFSNPACLAL